MWIYIFGQLYVFVFILSGRCVDFEPSRNMVTSNFDKNCTTCPEIYNSTDVFKSKYQRKFIFNFSIIVPSKSAFRKITVIIKYQVHVYICVLRNSYNSYVLFSPCIMFWESYIRSFFEEIHVWKDLLFMFFQTHIKFIIYILRFQ